MAHKRAQWSTNNGRDSQPKYRWVKIFWWQAARAWNILLRQAGNKYECGENVYLWRDFTIHAYVDGIVKFSKKKKLKFNGRKYIKTYIHVVPVSSDVV